MTARLRLDGLLAEALDDRMKGLPGGGAPTLGSVGARGWNLLRQDLPLPCPVLKEAALAHNSRWMRRFLASSGAKLAPHGKTTMSPQLFQRQLDDGAWAITLATAHQVMVARRYGVPRILFANQLVGAAETRSILRELARDPAFDFYCLVDSPAGARLLAEAARAEPPGRPVQVLLEVGMTGGRAGARDLAAALAVARAVKEAAPLLALRGVEGFEGIVDAGDEAAAERQVAGFLDFLVAVAGACAAEFAAGPVILSAGGSMYFDMVAERFGEADLGRETLPVLRSGCYLTHDSGMYRRAFAGVLRRSGRARELGEGLRPALELWAYVLSRPEPTRAVLGFGRRDASYDAGLPVPRFRFRPGAGRPQAVADDHRVVAINDQHAYLDLPAASPFAVGDMVGLGISHPCLTFDKWQFVPVVDEDYNVVSAIRTFF